MSYLNNKVPSVHVIKTWINNFEETGSTVKKKGGSVKTFRTPQKIDAVRASVESCSRLSAVRHSKKLGLSASSVRRILHLVFHLHPYKIQVVQKLVEGDSVKRAMSSVHDRLAECEQRIGGHFEDVIFRVE